MAEAIEGYAENLPKLRVVAVYGGTGYGEQIREFKRELKWWSAPRAESWTISKKGT